MCERQRYSDLFDVISYAVEPACGEFVDDFDTAAIANELFEFTSDIDENGVQHGNAYFIEREGVDWEEIYAKHDHGEQLDKIVADAWHGDGTYTITDSNGCMEKVECDEKKDLKHELHEFFQCYDNWGDKVVIAKIDEDE